MLAQSIRCLEDDLHDSVTRNGSLNGLADLLGVAYTAEDPQDTSRAIYALYRVFVVIISSNKLESGGDEAAKVVKAWIWERFQSYVDFLGSLLQDEEKFLRVRLMLFCFTVN
jgi:U3 small nucleolar RNA-associated protein 19